MSEVEDEAEGWGQGASQDGLFWASLGSGAAFPESVVRSSSEQCPPVDCRVPCSSEPASVPTFALRGGGRPQECDSGSILFMMYSGYQ